MAVGVSECSEHVVVVGEEKQNQPLYDRQRHHRGNLQHRVAGDERSEREKTQPQRAGMTGEAGLSDPAPYQERLEVVA